MGEPERKLLDAMPPQARAVLLGVAGWVGVGVEDALSTRREKRLVLTRSVTLYVLRLYQRPRPSLPELGRLFGRSASTVISAIEIIELASADPSVAEAIKVGRRELAGAVELQALSSELASAQERSELRRKVAELNRGTGT